MAFIAIPVEELYNLDSSYTYYNVFYLFILLYNEL